MYRSCDVCVDSYTNALKGELMFVSTFKIAFNDIFKTFATRNLVIMLGWQDIRQRYRRSLIGPFWITLSMGVTIAAIGFVFGQIFRSPMDEFLPFLAVGLIFWGLISTTVSEGCTAFISAQGIIKQLPVPLFAHLLRVVWRNVLISGHNLLIVPLVFLALSKSVSWIALLSLPGFVLLVMNVGWLAFVLAILCTRFRDLTQMTKSVFQVLFYFTPIIWMPKLLPDRAGASVLEFNPFYHWLEIVRAPLLGEMPNPSSWIVASAMAILGWIFALILFGRYRGRIAYWL